MERLNESGQWIVLMGIMVSIGIFFLAFIINQSTLVGQTTAEGVLEFPKNEIQDTRDEIFRWASHIQDMPEPIQTQEEENALRDISTLARYRRNTEVWFDIDFSDVGVYPIYIHYNNGVTDYNERNPIFYPEEQP
jgi:hypothetical protein